VIPPKLFLLLSVLAIAANSVCSVASETKALTLNLEKPANVTQGGDVRQLKHLAAGVGWEFDPNQETDARLKDLGIKRIRCINVDAFDGSFGEDGSFSLKKEPARMKAHLATCRELDALPHVILGMYVPTELRVKKEDVKAEMGALGFTPSNHVYWSGDWKKMRAYWKTLFQYVLIDNHFPNACFEVGNEADIAGAFPRPIGESGKMGSRKLYDAYFEVYRNAALAAAEFEQEHPGIKVRMGNSTFAVFTFGFGDFNWVVEFLKDCSAKKVKLDFIGFHYYGNVSSLHGEYEGAYPSFVKMLSIVQEARDKYCPGIPLNITEWGAVYHNTNNSPVSLTNGGNVGAAWSAEFLKTMMENKVDDSLFLVTTDHHWVKPKLKEGETPKPDQVQPGVVSDNMWGWQSFFVNPQVLGKAWPKATYHVFSMIHKLAENRIELKGLGDGISGIASVDPQARRITLMLWNYKALLPENSPPVDLGPDVDVRLALNGADEIFGADAKVQTKRWLVSKDTSNALNEFQKTGKITEASELQEVKFGQTFTLPTASVTFIEWTAAPDANLGKDRKQ